VGLKQKKKGGGTTRNLSITTEKEKMFKGDHSFKSLGRGLDQTRTTAKKEKFWAKKTNWKKPQLAIKGDK